MMVVWIVVLSDRHFDDCIDVFGSRAGADAKVREYQDSYSERWPKETWRYHGTSRTWHLFDDGPTIRLVNMEVQP